jgi:hypothetical protein
MRHKTINKKRRGVRRTRKSPIKKGGNKQTFNVVYDTYVKPYIVVSECKYSKLSEISDDSDTNSETSSESGETKNYEKCIKKPLERGVIKYIISTNEVVNDEYRNYYEYLHGYALEPKYEEPLKYKEHPTENLINIIRNYIEKNHYNINHNSRNVLVQFNNTSDTYLLDHIIEIMRLEDESVGVGVPLLNRIARNLLKLKKSHGQRGLIRSISSKVFGPSRGQSRRTAKVYHAPPSR